MGIQTFSQEWVSIRFKVFQITSLYGNIYSVMVRGGHPLGSTIDIWGHPFGSPTDIWGLPFESATDIWEHPLGSTIDIWGHPFESTTDIWGHPFGSITNIWGHPLGSATDYWHTALRRGRGTQIVGDEAVSAQGTLLVSDHWLVRPLWAELAVSTKPPRYAPYNIVKQSLTYAWVPNSPTIHIE